MKKNKTQREYDFWEGLFAELSSAVFLLDENKSVFYLNSAGERILESSFHLVGGEAMEQFWEQQVKLSELIEEVLATGRTLMAHEIELPTKKGEVLFKVEISPVQIAGRSNPLLFILEELSTLQTLREEGRVLDRLAMMGTLASGLAHEIRNPLGGIRAAAEMLQRESQDDASQEYIPMIISEVDRVNQLVTQLLDFAKPHKIEKTKININQLLSELLLLQKIEMGKKNIVLKQEFDPSLPSVEGDPASLKQAFLNIIKNAIEAMGPGGILKVSTGINYDHRIVEARRVVPMAQICISDTGPGIEEADLKSLFTPFFTTKAKGTGLGLMMTQRILKEHEGFLRISTQVGQGSQFKVLLKLARENA